MRKILLFIISLLACIKVDACCEEDNRTLSELLFGNRGINVFRCEIISTAVDSDFNVFSIAKVVEIYSGHCDSTNVKLLTGNINSSAGAIRYKPKTQVLVYTKSFGNIFSGGGMCDKWTRQFTGSPEQVSEINIVKQFWEILNKRKSGKFIFNDRGVIIAEGKFKKGKPVGIWKNYYWNGNLKNERNLRNNSQISFYDNNFLKDSTVVYRDSSVSFSYSNEINRRIIYKSVTIPNNSGDYLRMYEYYETGILKIVYGQYNINVEHGSTSYGKSGLYIEYYMNGNIKVNGNYSNNIKTGVWKEFDWNGKLISETDYKEGSKENKN